MIVFFRQQAQPERIEQFMDWIQQMGLDTQLLQEESCTLLAILGDTTAIDPERIRNWDVVEAVRAKEPQLVISRAQHPQDTVITLSSGAKIGGGHFLVMAGPCSVESEEQIISTAESVKAAGAQVLRGGAFKPRTSPYAFQGLQREGISLLLQAKAATGLPIVTEIMDVRQLPLFDQVDILQIGARNMQNYELLKELGRLDKPILLKRGMSSTLQELLMSAEYILSGGNRQVILCERGIRTFETAARNTLDLSAIPLLHHMSHLPVVADPSHATGRYPLVTPMAMAATAAGADGLLIEVHSDPLSARSDGPQSLRPDHFAHLMERIRLLQPLADHSFAGTAPPEELQ